MMEPSFEKLLGILASLIGWKEKSVREKDRLDAMALRKLEEDPGSFD